MGYKQTMSSGTADRRLHAFFAGRVQGVGFRYSVCRIAENYSVTGFVRNLSNGDVEIVAEGPEVKLNGFLFDIRNSRLKEFIFQEKTEWMPVTGEFEGFKVRY